MFILYSTQNCCNFESREKRDHCRLLGAEHYEMPTSSSRCGLSISFRATGNESDKTYWTLSSPLTGARVWLPPNKTKGAACEGVELWMLGCRVVIKEFNDHCSLCIIAIDMVHYSLTECLFLLVGSQEKAHTYPVFFWSFPVSKPKRSPIIIGILKII